MKNKLRKPQPTYSDNFKLGVFLHDNTNITPWNKPQGCTSGFFSCCTYYLNSRIITVILHKHLWQVIQAIRFQGMVVILLYWVWQVELLSRKVKRCYKKPKKY